MSRIRSFNVEVSITNPSLIPHFSSKFIVRFCCHCNQPE